MKLFSSLQVLVSIIILLPSSNILYSQSVWQDMSFNTKTGKEMSLNEWMSVSPEEFDLFKEEQPLKITLESNFRNFSRNKFKDQYQEALLQMPFNDSVMVKRVVTIKPRGEFRKRYCSKPPIKLNLKKAELYMHSMQRLEKMKVVSSCKNSRTYEQYVLKEYLTYKLYQIFTDISFKAKLLEITYVDTGWKKIRRTSSYAFLIEEPEDVAKRNDMIALNIKNATQKDIIETDMVRFSLFQYMIGNVDWSISGEHNIKIMKGKNPLQPKVYVAPYDFDYSGLVNADYATSGNGFDIENVRQRLFRCRCYSETVFKENIAMFIAKKKEVYKTINSIPYMTEATKKDVANYIDEFYTKIESKNAIKYFLSNCGKSL